MKKIITALAMTALFMACTSFSKGYEVKKQAGEYEVVAQIDRNPPIAGDNNLTIKIKDASGKYVTDAKVMVYYSMPAMPGMPAMNYIAETPLSGNEYKSKMTLSMSGSWNIEIKITREGKVETMKFTVDAK
ncbi:MAG: FixH family protein [bacterium]